MKLFKKVILISLILLFFVFPLHVKAQEEPKEFEFDATNEYRIANDGHTRVTQNINIINNIDTVYIDAYKVFFGEINPSNIVVKQNNKEIKYTRTRDDERNEIEISFDDPVVGVGAINKLQIIYETDSIAKKNGEVWEISVPGIKTNNAYKKFTAVIYAPVIFGKEAYVTPKPITQSEEGNDIKYTFDILKSSDTPLLIAFGEFQVYSFKLNYHLENPLNNEGYTEISIPPDTNYQTVYYESLEPRPREVNEDADGNWLAKYYLKPRERIEVSAKGVVQIYSTPRFENEKKPEDLSIYLQPTEYWQNSDDIKKIASRLKTPSQIYNYVVETLNYDYTRVTSRIERFGALAALNNPNNALCMEFTDLFVALSRSAGIPAREMNGYAYTSDKQLQPLSLVTDVLHAWPQYWDVNKGKWISVDPTWQKTSGVDYFTNFDLKHFTFVIHGLNPTKPYPAGSYKIGSSPQKDVFVDFGKLPLIRKSEPVLSFEKIENPIFMGLKYKFVVNNNGPTVFNTNSASVVLGDKKLELKSDDTRLLPFDSYSYEVKIPFSFFGITTPNKLSFYFGDKNLDLVGLKNYYILPSLFMSLLLIMTVVSVFLLKLFLPKIKGLFIKIPKLTKNDQTKPQ